MMTAYEEAAAHDPLPDAPISDNPSGMYCKACRETGLSHCMEVEHCGGMQRMRIAPTADPKHADADGGSQK